MPDRLSNLRVVDPVLTNLAVGYSNAELIGDVLFPFAQIDKEAGKVPKFGKEAFKLYNTERALRAKSNRINPEGQGTIDVVLDEHDLEYPIDYREDQESMFPMEAHATNVVTEGIRLRHEKMCADLAQNPANFPSGNKIILSGTSRFTDKANSDPVGVVEDGKEAIRQKIGKRPNTMVIGAAAYKSLKHHPLLLEKIKYSMKGVLTKELLQEIFEVQRIVVGEGVYSSDYDTFGDLWGDNIILAYVKPNAQGMERSHLDPSFGYTLRKRGQPLVDKYDEGRKLRLIRNTDIFKPVLLGAEAGYLIADTNA